MNRKMTKIVAAFCTATLLIFSTGTATAGGLLEVSFDPTNFSNGMVIDNPYWPLLPYGVMSRTFTYIGETDDECVIDVISANAGDIKILHGDDNPVYAGFMAQVILDREWVVEDCDTVPTEDDLAELTYDWYAQDDFGNIWYLGEASRDFGDDCPSLMEVMPGADDWRDFSEFQEDCTEGSWEAGQFGPDGEIIGRAGIVVPSDYPTGPTGDKLSAGTYYMQEVAEGAEDVAKILKTNASVSIEDGQFTGHYEDCRKVKEWTALEPGGSVEHKYYCPGIDGPGGLVLINGLTGGPTESEILIEMTSN